LGGGSPLFGDFLVQARLLFEGRDRDHLVYKKSFEAVFKWINTLRGAFYYVEFDLDNMEHIFSLAEMKNRIAPNLKGDDLVTHLRYVILETLDRSIFVDRDQDRVTPDSAYWEFTQRLKALNDRRQKAIDCAISDFSWDTVITFN